MKYEATVYKPDGTEPSGLSYLIRHYAYTTKFLIDLCVGKIRFSEDLRVFTGSVSLSHGNANVIRHTLPGTNVQVSLSGRVEMFVVSNTTPGQVTVIPRLLTTALVNPPIGGVVTAVTVVNPLFFRRGDTVRIGTNVRTIAEIQDNVITMDKSFLHDNVYSMSLDNETTTVTIY